ncbi:Lar family restriction alleviation protein [Pedobacter sp.]|uniref:Lar family restriction alleviation protein n=1 Tax=Pedobacter sp. TaxID=1411316 RepID=UPI0035664896
MKAIKVPENLKPCPVCGNRPLLCSPLEGISGYVIRCKEWDCFLMEGENLDELVLKWNGRGLEEVRDDNK